MENLALLNCTSYGQTEDVLDSWRRMFRLKRIGYYREIEIDEWQAEGEVVILSSVPNLPERLVAKVRAWVESGGRLFASGPIGAPHGPCAEIASLTGCSLGEPREERGVPRIISGIEPFQPGDTLLFLESQAPRRDLLPDGAKVLADSAIWNPATERYEHSNRASIVEYSPGQGRVIYTVYAPGDLKRTPALRAGEWFPDSNPEDLYHIGNPDFSDEHGALSQLLFAILCRLVDRPLASLGHWPGGWRTVVSLTGDIHEFEEYSVDQTAAAYDMADFLERNDLAGRFTFSVTGKALDDNPAVFQEMVERGYQVVPHSAVRATWLNQLSPEEQRREIDRCLEIFGKHLPEESRRGWRSHGWSGTEETEAILAEKGIRWTSNLLLQRYGEFGENDRHVNDGVGIAFTCLPEYHPGGDLLRLPNTMLSPDWLRVQILGWCYGQTSGPELDEATVRLMKEHFYRDWRFEALHLVDWHPWEELIEHPVFQRSTEELVSLFSDTANVGYLQPAEIADWWRSRSDVIVRQTTSGDNRVEATLDLGQEETRYNPTVRFSGIPWKIATVTIDGEDWRYFGPNWMALPVGAKGTVKVEADYSWASPHPQLVDTSSIVSEAYLEDGCLSVRLEEIFLPEGSASLYFTRPAKVYVDGESAGDRFLGHKKIRYPKGAHHITMELI